MRVGPDKARVCSLLTTWGPSALACVQGARSQQGWRVTAAPALNGIRGGCVCLRMGLRLLVQKKFNVYRLSDGLINVLPGQALRHEWADKNRCAAAPANVSKGHQKSIATGNRVQPLEME